MYIADFHDGLMVTRVIERDDGDDELGSFQHHTICRSSFVSGFWALSLS